MKPAERTEREHEVKELAQLVLQVAKLEASNRKLQRERDIALAGRRDNDLMLQALPNGLIVIDQHNMISYMNDAACRMLHTTSNQTLNQSLDDIVTCLPQLAGAQPLLQTPPEKNEIIIKHQESGDQQQLRMTGSQIYNGKGARVETVLQLEDVTITRQLDQMKTDAISMAGHELRSPLTTITGFTELLMSNQNLTQEQQQQFLGYVLEKAELMTHLVADMQEAARLENGRPLRLHTEECDLRDLIKQTAQEIGWHYGTDAIRVLLPKQPLPVNIDRMRMTQLLTNLLSNAIKYSLEGSPVEVFVKTDTSQVTISVMDQGAGIPEEQLEKVFQRYYRAPEHSNQARGLGLGLTISQAIIQAHGGILKLTSEVGQGTNASFSLPLCGSSARPHPPFVPPERPLTNSSHHLYG